MRPAWLVSLSRPKNMRVTTQTSFGALHQELKKRYHERGLVIAVGAGLSMASGLPTWIEILRRLAQRCYGSDGESFFEQLLADGYTLPAIASILEASSPSKEIFTRWLREELYSGFPFYGGDVTGENKKEFIRIVEQNKTLAAVARLCVNLSQKKNSGYIRNPLIHGIVNFNFDAVFREYVRHKYGRGIFRTIERPSAGARLGRIPVYHMHGYLHFEAHKFYDLAEEAPDVRVFTEQEYFDFFNRPTSIYNYTFLHLLREYHCLFLGLSLKDDNIRRLLHYSKSERLESDIKEGTREKEAEERSCRHFALYPRYGAHKLNELTERSLRRLGIRVVWFESFDAIPEILDYLRS